MAAVTELWVPYDGWSVDELPDVDVRYELVDGALLVTPPPVPGGVELDPLVLVVHRLVDDAYEVIGSYDDEVALDEPVPVTFRVATLLD